MSCKETGMCKTAAICFLSGCQDEAKATTASASDGSIYESVSRRSDPVGHAEAMAQLDEVLGRAPVPSRNAAPLDKPVVDGVDEAAFQHAWEYMVDGTDTIDARWLRRFVAAYREASESSALAEQYSDLLRKICFEYSAGGYNSEGLMPPETADAKIRWIIDDTRRAALTQQSAAQAPNKLATYPLEELGCEDAPDDHKLFRTNDWQLTAGDVRKARAAQASHAGADTERAQREAVEAKAKEIYATFCGAEDHPWVEGGNSDMQFEARLLARAAMSAATEKKEKP